MRSEHPNGINEMKQTIELCAGLSIELCAGPSIELCAGLFGC